MRETRKKNLVPEPRTIQIHTEHHHHHKSEIKVAQLIRLI